MNLKKSILLIFIILLADQISKIYIKTNFQLNERVEIFSWLHVFFIENEGMAWGAKIPGEYGKLFLTLFRIVAVGGIAYWLLESLKKQASNFFNCSYLLNFFRSFWQHNRFCFLWRNF